jgi:succinate dehydrogenase/fumarate reductase flavoprotein subunit
MLEDHPHTYTLPYGFKFIATDVASEAITDLNHAAVTIAAESTQDTVTFKSANIWTKLSANSNDDSVTFGHLVRDIVVSDIANTNLNIDNSTVNNVLAEAEDLTDKHHINIQDITHDEAGHIRSR